MKQIQASRILVKCPNWIGDLMMSLPALYQIHHDNPQAQIFYLMHRKLKPLVRFIPWVNHVIEHMGVKNLGEWLGWIRDVRSTRATAGVLCTNSFKSALLTRLGGVKQLSGLTREGRSWLLSHPIVIDEKMQQMHRHYWYASLCRPFVDAVPQVASYLSVPQDDRDNFPNSWPEGHQAIAMAVGTAFGPSKEYGLERFSQVVESLKAKDFHIVVVGTPKEVEVGDQLVKRFPDCVTNLAGKTSITQLVVALSKLQGYVGNDSGPMHIAAMLGKPTVGIYGPTDPTWVGPLGPRARFVYEKQECSPCYIKVCPLKDEDHMRCMKAIDPDKVVKIFLDLYSENP